MAAWSAFGATARLLAEGAAAAGRRVRDRPAPAVRTHPRCLLGPADNRPTGANRPLATVATAAENVRMTREQRKAIFWGLLTAGVLALAIFIGSRNLKHIDAALVGYTFACLFAAFGL